MNHPRHGGAISHGCRRIGPWTSCLTFVPRAHPRPILRYVRAITRHFARVNIAVYRLSESVYLFHFSLTHIFSCYRTEQLRLLYLQSARTFRVAISSARPTRAWRENIRGEHATTTSE